MDFLVITKKTVIKVFLAILRSYMSMLSDAAWHCTSNAKCQCK